jgi:glycerophosphoryl diester phosphodiesterase
MPDPVLLAHRGGRAHGRENTLATARRSVALGATGTETDLCLTRDGQLVCLHDPVLRRGWRRSAVAALDRDALPTDVPTFSDWLDDAALSALPVSVDLKVAAAAPALLRLLEGRPDASRVWMCGGLSQLRGWREDLAGASVVPTMVLSRRRGDVDLGQVTVDLVDAVNHRWDEWDSAHVSRVKGLGCQALAWGFAGSVRRMAQALRMGVDGIYGDDVTAMVRARGQVVGHDT